jgi:hypothetical protein
MNMITLTTPPKVKGHRGYRRGPKKKQKKKKFPMLTRYPKPCLIVLYHISCYDVNQTVDVAH